MNLLRYPQYKSQFWWMYERERYFHEINHLNHTQMKHAIPHRKPRLQELKHKGQTRFVRVNNATWVQTYLDISDEEAIKIFNEHQTRINETLKNPTKIDTHFFD